MPKTKSFTAHFYKVTDLEIIATGKTELYPAIDRETAVEHCLYTHRLHNRNATASLLGVVDCLSCGQIAVVKDKHQTKPNQSRRASIAKNRAEQRGRESRPHHIHRRKNMTDFGNQLQKYAQGNSNKCLHPIKSVDDNNFCHACNVQIKAKVTETDKLRARIAELEAAHAMQDESLVVLPRWMVSNLADKTDAINAALEDVKYYVGNPSAWEHYDDGVSEKIRAILKAAGMA